VLVHEAHDVRAARSEDRQVGVGDAAVDALHVGRYVEDTVEIQVDGADGRAGDHVDGRARSTVRGIVPPIEREGGDATGAHADGEDAALTRALRHRRRQDLRVEGAAIRPEAVTAVVGVVTAHDDEAGTRRRRRERHPGGDGEEGTAKSLPSRRHGFFEDVLRFATQLLGPAHQNPAADEYPNGHGASSEVRSP
jgi:hypothetical protein